MQTEGAYGGVLTEGRYFYNPFAWGWEIGDQFVVPNGKIGIRVALDGAELPAGSVIAEPGPEGHPLEGRTPGPVPVQPLRRVVRAARPGDGPRRLPGGRHPALGQAGQGPHQFLVGEGERGVQKKTLDPGTYYLNPYERRVSLVDCRSKRFNLGEGSSMDFLSSDGFPVTLDGAVEFRVIPELASEVFVKYNESDNGD